MPHLFLGLISGTSADGIDAALVEFPDSGTASGLRLVAARTHPWAPALRGRLVALGQGGEPESLDELGRLDVQVAHAFADAALSLLAEALNYDFASKPLDEPLTTEELKSMQGILGIRDGVLKNSGKSNPSALDFVNFSGRGQVHDAIVGGPKL